MRLTYRMNPNLTTAHFSALAAYARNDTALFMRKYLNGSKDQTHIRKLGRERNRSGATKKFNQRLLQVKKSKLANKMAIILKRQKTKEKKEAALQSTKIIHDVASANELKLPEIDIQLRIHRDILHTEGLPKPFSLMKDKKDKLAALVNAIHKLNRRVTFTFKLSLLVSY